MACAVVAILLQIALLMVMARDPAPLPPRLGLAELLWAAARRPAFNLLIACLTVAPVLTYLAATVRGRHRRALGVSWVVFIALMIYPFGERVLIMLRVIERVAW
jgi:hypothetical protein